MDDCQFLILPSNGIIFIGKKPSEKVIQISRKPSFFDAVNLSKPSTQNSPYQYIPLKNSIKETYHFYDYNHSRTITFIFKQHTLLILCDQSLSKETIYNVLNYFLVKKGNRIHFLTHLTGDKVIKKRRDKQRVHSEQKEVEE